MSSVAYIMQWGDHKTNVHNHLRVLFEEQKFVDLTLFCSTHSVKVHSVVIASNSSYFEKVLLSQNGVNSVIVLKDMKFEVLRALIEFMYCGKTTVLDEDVDALLYASKKFEVKGLSRMTRQGVMFSAAEKEENETTEFNHRFIFPAESAHPGMIQAVIDLTKKKDETKTLNEKKSDSNYLKKTGTSFQRRGRPNKKHENFGFSEAAMSDTEYAILKEAEESRKALEKLQKYVLNPNGVETASRVLLGENSFLKSGKNQGKDKANSLDHSYSNSEQHSVEDEIAAENLSYELNEEVQRQQQQQQQQTQQHPQHALPPILNQRLQQNHNSHLLQSQLPQQETRNLQVPAEISTQKLLQNNSNGILEPSLLPTDVPIFVDDGNGNYVTLDVEMASMIAGQEIKYNLFQGLVMTSDGKGSQLCNPASILIPETQTQFDGMPVLNCGEIEFPKLGANPRNLNSSASINEKYMNCFENGSPDGNTSKRKPFVVKEIIKLKQAKTKTGPGSEKSIEDNRAEEENNEADMQREYEEGNEEEGEGDVADKELINFENSGIRGILF